MLRLWNKLCCLDNDRLCKKVFDWDYDICKHNWTHDVKKIFFCLDMENIFESKIPIDITYTSTELDRLDCEEWKVEINCVPKLRTYVLFKSEYHIESHIKQIISKKYRAVLAQFRSGILPLKVETGRFSNIPLAKRLYEFCSSNAIEDETHFLLYCDHYNELRRNLFDLISQSFADFEDLDQRDQIKILMDFPSIVKSTAGFRSDALRKRTNSFQTNVSWRHWYVIPAIQALWRRSDRRGSLLWLPAPAVVLVTTGGATGERGFGRHGCFSVPVTELGIQPHLYSYELLRLFWRHDLIILFVILFKFVCVPPILSLE